MKMEISQLKGQDILETSEQNNVTRTNSRTDLCLQLLGLLLGLEGDESETAGPVRDLVDHYNSITYGSELLKD